MPKASIADMFSWPDACLMLYFFGLSPDHDDELKRVLALSG